MNVVLECQEELAKLAQSMIQVGCVSIANSNTVVRTLEAKLQGVDKKELSEMARKELENVVSQIKMQQNIWGKLSQLEENVYEHEKNLESKKESDKIRDEAIAGIMQKEIEQDSKLAEQKLHTNTQSRQIRELKRCEELQDKKIEVVQEINAKQDEQIEDIQEVNAKQDEQIEDIQEVNAKQSELS